MSTSRLTDLTRKVMSDSACVRAVRPVVAGSLLCRSVVMTIDGAAEVYRLIVRRLALESADAERMRVSQQIAPALAGSAVIGTLANAVTRVSNFSRDAFSRRLVEPFVSRRLVERVTILARVVLVAIVVQTVVVLAGGSPIGWPGVAGRLLLAGAAALAMRYSGVLATAWVTRRTDRRPRMSL